MTESSLRRVLAVVRARWPLLALLAVPILALSVWYAASQEPEYRSESVLTFAPTEGAAPNSTFLRLVRRYVVAATGSAAVRDAEERAGLPEDALRNAVTANIPPSTLQLSIQVVADTPQAAESAADALADEVVELTQTDELVAAEVIVEATEARDTRSTRRAVALAVGGMLALLPGTALAFGVEGARPRARVREDLQSLGIPVLSIVRGRALGALLRGGEDGVGTAGPRAWLVARGERGAVVTAPGATPADVAAVDGVTRLLGAPEEHLAPLAASPPGAQSAAGRPLRPDLQARPGLLTDQAVADEVLGSGRCVLVIREGTPLDVAASCVDLLNRLGVELVGAVLVH